MEPLGESFLLQHESLGEFSIGNITSNCLVRKEFSVIDLPVGVVLKHPVPWAATSFAQQGAAYIILAAGIHTE